MKKWREGLHRHSNKEDIQMANSHMKRCSTLLIIREMQVKTVMSFHLMTVKAATIKNFTDNKYWRGCGKKEPSYTVGGNVNWGSRYRQQDGGSLKTKHGVII